jgi:hypothetical protein
MVQAVIKHRRVGSKPKDLQFWVRWEGYDESEDSWVDWKDIYNNAILHAYLYANKMGKLVPPIFQIKDKEGKKLG